MNTKIKKTILLVAVIMVAIPLTGCTNWKKKYNLLNVEHQNLKGRYEFEKSQRNKLLAEAAEREKTIEELQKEIEERNVSADVATGFEGMDVTFDPAAGTITVTLDNKILFDPGKAELKKNRITELDHILSVLNQNYAGNMIDVVGHTDADPIKKSKWKDNWELSSQRALTVVRYLTNKGFNPAQIRAAGCGEHRPVAPNTSISGKAKNRRVEIVVNMRG